MTQLSAARETFVECRLTGPDERLLWRWLVNSISKDGFDQT